MKNVLIILGSILLGILIGLFWFTSTETNEYQNSTFPVVVLEKYSNDPKKAALIYQDRNERDFYFGFRMDSLDLVIDSVICRKGYHDPLINLTWKNDRIVEIRVDNDFGDLIEYWNFNCTDLSLHKLPDHGS